VVAVDNSAVLNTPQFRIGKLPPLGLSGLTAIIAALTVLATVAGYGFSESGFRMGSKWHGVSPFSSFSPCGRRPALQSRALRPLRHLGPQRRQLVWSFCAAFGVYLFSVFAPNVILPSLHASFTAA